MYSFHLLGYFLLCTLSICCGTFYCILSLCWGTYQCLFLYEAQMMILRLLRFKDGAPPAMDVYTSQILQDRALYMVISYPANTTFSIRSSFVKYDGFM